MFTLSELIFSLILQKIDCPEETGNDDFSRLEIDESQDKDSSQLQIDESEDIDSSQLQIDESEDKGSSRLEIDEKKPSNIANDQPVAKVVVPADNSLKSPRDSSCEKGIRLVSKQEHEEFSDLFGEASDEEVDPQAGDDCTSESDVVELPTVVKSPGTVIDLTADTDDDDGSDGNHQETVDVKLHSSSQGNYKHSHKKSDDKTHKHKKRKKSDDEEVAVSEEPTPITVSSASDAGQCKELFDMFEYNGTSEMESANDMEVSLIGAY